MTTSSDETRAKDIGRRDKLSRLFNKTFGRGERASGLCTKPFCRALGKFDHSSDSRADSIGVAYERYLRKRLRDQREILVGTKTDIEAQHETCSFCHFVYSRFVAQGYTDLAGDTRCFVLIQAGSEEVWLQLRDVSDKVAGLLLGYGERMLFVEGPDRSSPRAGNLVEDRELDYARVQSWLQLCDERHSEVCPVPAASKNHRSGVPSMLRVVDLECDCITEILWNEKYITLSYVWGNAVPPKLMSEDLPRLEHKGSLTEMRKTMPRTIQDAMHFATNIGAGINTMDVIYESAYLTIIAAAGPSADSGLPGIGKTPRALSQQVLSVKPGLSLLMVQSLDKHLNNSVWATRGWTLQEHYLSRKTIVFVNGQAYFRCRQRIWSEETWSDKDPNFQDTEEWSTNLVALMAEAMDLDEGGEAPYEYFATTVARFQRRVLSYESDALNAMAGVLQRVGSLAKTVLLEGLPVAMLPTMLIFLHLGPQPHGAVNRRPGFPTWSWAGWKGVPTWYAFNALDLYQHPENLWEWPNMKSWIVWYVSRNGNCPSLLWAPGDAISRSEHEPDSGFPPFDIKGNFEHLELNMSAITPSSVQPLRSYPVLVFFSIAILLNVRNIKFQTGRQDGTVDRMCSTHDISGALCGYLYPDIEVSDATNDLHELILLSECCNIEFPIRKMAGSDDADPRPQYWVMLVVRTEDGVYERRAIGHVLHEAVEMSFKPGPMWKEIVLG